MLLIAICEGEIWLIGWEHEGVAGESEDIVKVRQMAEVATGRGSIDDWRLIPAEVWLHVWPRASLAILRRARRE
jgi:hypothetical protein